MKKVKGIYNLLVNPLLVIINIIVIYYVKVTSVIEGNRAQKNTYFLFHEKRM